MTALEACKRDIEGKLESIKHGWRELADNPNPSGADRYMRRQALFSKVAEFKELVRELDRLNGPPN
jgi:hypothetical protein